MHVTRQTGMKEVFEIVILFIFEILNDLIVFLYSPFQSS